jgi:hypothetical protein
MYRYLLLPILTGFPTGFTSHQATIGRVVLQHKNTIFMQGSINCSSVAADEKLRERQYQDGLGAGCLRVLPVARWSITRCTGVSLHKPRYR